MKTFSQYIAFLIPVGLFAFFAFVTIAFAQEPKKYTPLVGIPGITDQENMTIPQYINALYYFTISVGALLGVMKIAFAGVKYSMSDVVTDKGDAKKDIQGVLLGLAILLLPFVVLNTIYPGLTNLDVLQSAQKVDLKPAAEKPAGANANTYQSAELSGIGNTIRANAQQNLPTEIPVRNGSEQERSNICTQCTVNASGYSCFKLPEKNVYVCKP